MSDTPDSSPHPQKVPDAVPPPLPGQADAKSRPDVLIYQGGVSLWLGAKSILSAVVLEVISLAALIYASLNSGSSLATVLLVGGLALFVASNLMLGYVILRIRSLKYKITNRLIEREQGIIFRRVDALDLARVKDVELSQSLFERMAGVGTIEVFSSDKTDPDLLLESIPNPRPVYEQLRDAVIEISQRRGIVSMSS